MGKKRDNGKKAAKNPGNQSVNPLGNSPDTEFAGEVYSQGAEAAKKKNTK
ncbi:small, acid-soluble spore protein L [Anaerobacillus sp. MEB173]